MTKTTSRRKLVLSLALVAVAVAVAVIVALVAGGDDDPSAAGASQESVSTSRLVEEMNDGRVLLGSRQAPFAMKYSDQWTRVPDGTLTAADGETRAPVAGLQRKDRTGLVTITVGGPVRGGMKALRERLSTELRSRFDDFRLVSQRELQVAGGTALYTSWVRTETGRVQANMVLRDGQSRTFSIDTVVSGSAKRTAAEVGLMLRSFDVGGE